MSVSGSAHPAVARARSVVAQGLLRGAVAYAAWVGVSLLLAVRAEHVIREYEHSSASIPRLDRLAIELGEAHWHGLLISGALLCLGAATLPHARRSAQVGRWVATCALFVVVAGPAVTVLGHLAARAELAAAMSSLAGRAAPPSAAPLALQLTWLWAPALHAGLSSALLRASPRPAR